MNAKKSKKSQSKMWNIERIKQELQKQHLMTDDCDFYMDYSNLKEDEIILLNGKEPYDVDDMPSGLEALAQTLNFYTPRGYDHVRETLKLNLPPPRLLRKLYIHTDGTPGYSKEMLDFIKTKAISTKQLCSLAAVMMRVNCNEKADYGCQVDFGGPDSDEDCKEVIIFMVTFLNEALSIPVGYFAVRCLDEHQLKNMTVGCLELLHESGAQVVALSAELESTALRAAKLLGCSFKTGTLKTTFEHPVTKEPIALFLDPSKSIAYIRLALQANSPIKSANSIINWSHVEIFFDFVKINKELQDELNKAHINLRGKNKEKAALRMMSNSLVESARALSQKIPQSQVTAAGPTIEFIETFNKAYEMLTSRAMSTTRDPENNHKAPMNTTNVESIRAFFKKLEDLMKNLKGKKGNLLLQSESPGEGMGYIGLLTCMHSAMLLYNKLVATNQLNALPLHKFTLEPIRLVMNNIRAKYDVEFYNDPKCRYIKHFFKTLVKNVNSKKPEEKIKELKKASMLQKYSAVETINVTSCRSDIFDCDHIVEPSVTKEQDDTCKLIYHAPKELLDYTNPIQTYVAGLVASFLTQVIFCDTCNGALIESKNMKPKHASIEFHDSYGCLIPSKDVVKVCEMAEKQIQHAMKTSHTDESF